LQILHGPLGGDLGHHRISMTGEREAFLNFGGEGVPQSGDGSQNQRKRL
jgi:hypothetical protein